MASPGNDSPSWAQLALRVGFFSLRHRPWRRKLMFYLTLGTVAQFALGVVILDSLASSILLFLLYWGFCALLVCVMLLLALYDMLAVRQEQQLELMRLREQMFAEQSETMDHGNDSGASGKT